MGGKRKITPKESFENQEKFEALVASTPKPALSFTFPGAKGERARVLSLCALPPRGARSFFFFFSASQRWRNPLIRNRACLLARCARKERERGGGRDEREQEGSHCSGGKIDAQRRASTPFARVLARLRPADLLCFFCLPFASWRRIEGSPLSAARNRRSLSPFAFDLFSAKGSAGSSASFNHSTTVFFSSPSSTFFFPLLLPRPLIFFPLRCPLSHTHKKNSSPTTPLSPSSPRSSRRLALLRASSC